MDVRPKSPSEHIPQTQWTTPTRSKLRAGLKLIDSNRSNQSLSNGLTKAQLGHLLGVPRTTAWRISKSLSDRRHKEQEKRGRKPILSKKDINYLEMIVRRNGFEGRALTWEALANEINVNVSARTIRRALKQINYRRCITCQKS